MLITTAGGGMIAASLVGGLLGSGGSKQTQSTQQTLDPRMNEAVYGAGGVIPSAQDWYSQNKSGLNNQMLTGMDNQWNQLDASRQGYNQMQNLGMGLMGGGVSGNPFASGYSGGSNFGGSMGGNGGSIAPQAMSYQPAQNSGGGGSPFAAQYAVDQTGQAARTQAAEKAKAAPQGIGDLLALSNSGGGWGGGGAF